MQRIEFRAMGCRMLALLDSDSPLAVERLSQVPVWFEEWERQLSRFREDSELSRLNRRSGEATRVSQVVYDVAEAAVRAARDSDSLVVPNLLGALEAAGYDRSFENIDQAQTVALPPPRGADDWRAIGLDAPSRSISLPRGTRLDFGGIGKGWAADRAVHRLAKHGPALVNAGGDIALSGPQSDGKPWPIGVIDPLNRDEQIAMLMIPRGAVATSGRDYRQWQRGGASQHHILDPRTGMPAVTDVLSATVVAPTAREAEAAAKAAFILGSLAGLDWLDTRPTLAGLLALDDGQIIVSRRMEEYLRS
ncbi:MAG: FAD:protein FMN transferase [Chloroflexi bacterium]|nr:FAD:protein FMN transferase [Chloroflexota bacterium]